MTFWSLKIVKGYIKTYQMIHRSIISDFLCYAINVQKRVYELRIEYDFERRMEGLNKSVKKAAKVLAGLALGVTKANTNSTCVMYAHQPKLPLNADKLRKN